MKLNEILYLIESLSSNLYHGTGFFGANLILESNTLEAGEFNICSFSRQAGPAGIRGDNVVSKGNSAGGVIFVVDRDLLYRVYGKKLRPISPSGYGRTEAEEGVAGDIKNFSKYIKEIWVNVTPYTLQDVLDSGDGTMIDGASDMDILTNIFPYLFKDPRVVFKSFRAHFVE